MTSVLHKVFRRWYNNARKNLRKNEDFFLCCEYNYNIHVLLFDYKFFLKLTNCECCTRHIRNRPLTMTTNWVEPNWWNNSDNSCNCNCRCRHISRFLCRKYSVLGSNKFD